MRPSREEIKKNWNLFMKPTTEQLKAKAEELVKTYNNQLETQVKIKEAIIAIQAVIQDREEDGNTKDSNSTDSKN
tara:strand:- start:62 stop:286 length:225 start_codon:yes stop_codon:yes gene_type:complete